MVVEPWGSGEPRLRNTGIDHADHFWIGVKREGLILLNLLPFLQDFSSWKKSVFTKAAMASVKYGHLTQGFLCERSRGFEDFKQIK
jgi:hypothetical protein